MRLEELQQVLAKLYGLELWHYWIKLFNTKVGGKIKNVRHCLMSNTVSITQSQSHFINMGLYTLQWSYRVKMLALLNWHSYII